MYTLAYPHGFSSSLGKSDEDAGIERCLGRIFVVCRRGYLLNAYIIKMMRGTYETVSEGMC
jgi:hypothetical protein